ncbi:pleckstrin homology domain-containing family N member 1 isoform X1 [Erythrolamprus reginae]|uniref:pleckstrin homology domain-containing family N member 1 isoform X1 n=1 Tax=Erythrolamprus reginae TaxID=121349 RepID=UPI00396CF5BF
MGNMACVPQAPGRFRYSFSRKSSFKKEQESKKKLAGLFGFEGEHDRDVTSDKILQYIPAKNFASQENEKENLDQRFPSIFKKGRRRTVVRNLGKIIHYSKLKFKFQHCQEANDCYLELFQEFLYFQSLSSNGHKYQGLLPLTELQLTKLEHDKGIQEDFHAFQIAGPLLSPLIIYCPTQAELRHWLYHLEKQINLSGGRPELPLETQRPWPWAQGLLGKEQLRWSMQNAHVQEWKGTQRKSLGDILCVSKVKLQHLPFQEQHHRLLVLYPSTLVIVSEERNGLYFKGELPLNAIQVQFEENQKTDFLIEGRLINSIRVICSSYEDYQEWLYCLKTAQFRHADSSLSGSESFSGLKPSHLAQFSGSGRGSLTSEGRTNSWVSAGKGATTSTHHSQTSTASLSERQSVDAAPENRLAENSLPQPVCCSGKRGAGMPKAELKRKGSSRKSKGKGVVPPQQPQCHREDPDKKNSFPLISKHPRGEGISPVYNEPYSAPAHQQHPATRPLHLDLNNLKQWNVPKSQTCPAPQTLENLSLSSSPMYADPYTPNSPTSHGAAGSYFVEEFGRCHRPSALEHQNGYPALMPVSVPICLHPQGWKSFQPSGGNPWREPSLAHRGNASAPAFHFATEPAPEVHYLTTSTTSGDGLRMHSLPTSDESLQAYNLPETGGESLDSTYHDYAELQSFHEDYSYDNIWDTEAKKPPFSDPEIYDC